RDLERRCLPSIPPRALERCAAALLCQLRTALEPMMSGPKLDAGVALVIPVLNEAETIANVVRAVPREIIDDVVVVDGGSTDETIARATAAGARVLLEPRSGYGAACLAGACATSRLVVAFMDGDGSDDTADLPRLVGPILGGEQDFVIGSRTRGV